MPLKCDGFANDDGFKRIFTYPLIRNCDMPEEMKKDVLELCVAACHKTANNQEAAKVIKEGLDVKYGGSWHVVVGAKFGMEISYEYETLLYVFYGDSLALCVWRSS